LLTAAVCLKKYVVLTSMSDVKSCYPLVVGRRIEDEVTCDLTTEGVQ